jgi:DNA polymerase-1
LILSSKLSYRKLAHPSYKAHRKAEKPVYYDQVCEYLVQKKGAEIAPDGLEGDDWLGILHYTAWLMGHSPWSIVCTKDKDLRMIPGQLYMWHHDELLALSIEEANKWFYLQLLMGDTADNIKGLHRVGEVKASKLLEEVNPKEYEEFVLNLYQKEWGTVKGLEMFKMNKELLWIRREFDSANPELLGPTRGVM